MEQEKIADFLQQQRDQAPDDLQHYFLSFEDFWERKLWHELTDILVEYYQQPASEPQRIAIFNNFVSKFADKINQLKLVTIGLRAVDGYKGKPTAESVISASFWLTVIRCKRDPQLPFPPRLACG